MIILSYITTISVFFLALSGNSNYRYYRSVFMSITLSWLIIFAAFRDGSIMPDYHTYSGLFDNFSNNDFSYFIEFSFIVLVKVAAFIWADDAIILFLLYAILGVVSKFFAIRAFMPRDLIIYSFLVYSTNYFILHEMIQIRVGVATGLLYFAIYQLIRNNKPRFLMFVMFASVFHYSSVIFFILYFFNLQKFSVTKLLCSVIASYIINFLVIRFDLIIQLINLLPISNISAKMLTYAVAMANEGKIDIFGLFIVSRVIILLFFTFNYTKIVKKSPNIVVFINLYSLGVILYVALASVPVFAVRLSQFFFFSEVFLLPYIVVLFRGKILPQIILFAYCLLSLVMNIMFTTYFSWYLS